MTVPENIQFIAAVNRGSAFSGTFGIDAAQLDRFAPLQLDYLPPAEEVKLLAERHDDLPKAIVEMVVDLAHRVRTAPDIAGGLSVRATDEVCTMLKHPLIEPDRKRMLAEVLKSSFCGRFAGRWNDATSEAGAVWAVIEPMLRAGRYPI